MLRHVLFKKICLSLWKPAPPQAWRFPLNASFIMFPSNILWYHGNMEKSESNALTARWLCVCVCVYVKGCFCCCCLVTKLCPILCNPMDCSLPGSSVHGVSQARILEWVVMPSSTGSSQPRDRAHVSWLAGGSFITEPPGKSVLRALKGSIMLWEGS